MARRRLYGVTQKRRKKLSTARLKRHGSPQRVEATQAPAPFERAQEMDRQDLEFLEAMRELDVVPNRRRASAPVRLRQVAAVQFAAEQEADGEFLQAMAHMGVQPLRRREPSTAGQSDTAAPAGARTAEPDTVGARAAAREPDAPARPQPGATAARDGNGGTRFEAGGPSMAELLAGELDPAAKYEGAPATQPGRPVRPVREPETPDDELDLHGHTQEEAIRAVQGFLLVSHKRRYRAVLIITGKGTNSGDQGPVLRDAVYHWLERNGDRFARSFRWAPARHGGAGAIWVSLR